MYRRRRAKHEIPFSFDSFLDVVANVCGIIIRLILVAWVGARSYHSGIDSPVEQPSAHNEIVAAATSAAELPPITDPLEAALERSRQELARQQRRLLEQLRKFQNLESANLEIGQQLQALTASQAAVERDRQDVGRVAGEHFNGARNAQLSLADLEKRRQRLAAELRELETLPPVTKTLTYRTPVSRPVHTEELHFECVAGRVSFIDLQAFLIEIRRGLEDTSKQLKTRWEVEGTAGPVGAFRLRYALERERGLFAGGAPDPEASFHYGLAGWLVEPISPARGEAAPAALAPGASFRRLADAIDPELTVVTIWVYPDSFDLYRQLRDFLHERNIEVAGRPLPAGVPIASSRQGSASRGQ